MSFEGNAQAKSQQQLSVDGNANAAHEQSPSKAEEAPEKPKEYQVVCK
jgi:hypothetical protein